MKQELFLKSLYRKSTLCCCIVFLLWGCAKVGTPSGGPKDVAPPKIVECIPPNNSTNFHGNKITIKCNELIDLDNVAQNLLISPPMAKTPKVIANGKKVQIMFEKNQLRDSTTYSFFFGKSIKDYNEGNFIENFTYAFSTGKTIDSLRISGKVTDVLNGNPMEDMYVMLYTNLADSAPKKELPIFISKTKKNGTFELRNVKQTKYRIYALKDANNDLKFNQPKETFAFYDSVIVPTIALKKVTDSVKCSRKDSASTKKVSNKKVKPCKDTVLIKTDTTYSPNTIELKCFVEEQKTQFLANFTRETKEKVQFVFNMPLVKDSLVIEPLKVPVTKTQILQEFSSQKDTVTYWLVDKALINNDSLKIGRAHV